MALRKKIVYVDGTFDLFHAGHVEFLKEARGAGAKAGSACADVYLLAGVSNTDARWKHRPIMSFAERVAVVAACRYVDEVVESPPLALTEVFLDEHKVEYVVT